MENLIKWRSNEKRRRDSIKSDLEEIHFSPSDEDLSLLNFWTRCLSFSMNNDELIEFSPLTSSLLLLTRCDVRQCTSIHSYHRQYFNCFIDDAHVSTQTLSPSLEQRKTSASLNMSSLHMRAHMDKRRSAYKWEEEQVSIETRGRREKTWHLNWNRTFGVWNSPSDQTRCCLTPSKWWSKWIEN